LFLFVNVEKLNVQCYWNNSIEVIINLTTIEASVLQQINIGDTITLLNNTIKANCKTTSTSTSDDCVSYPYNTKTSSTIVLNPKNPIKPIVEISTATTIGACDFIVLDPTASSGYAGRKWDKISWYVAWVDNGLVVEQNVSSIKQWLNDNYGGSSTSYYNTLFFIETRSYVCFYFNTN
jgi:hypothetical protein